MANTKTTQESVDVLSSFDARSRTTQESVDVLSSLEDPHSRITQESVDVLSSPATPEFTRNRYVRTGRLGCEDWVVQITRKGGGTVLLEAPVVGGTCGRKQDDFSTAQAVFAQTGLPSYCAGVLAKLKPWAYEIALWRGGDEAWVGPISDQLQFTKTQVIVSARDLFSVFEVRNHPVNRTFEDEDLSTIFAQYVADGLVRDPSPAITLDVEDSGVVGSNSVQADEEKRVADSLRNLASTALDFTMLGRTLHVRGSGGGRLIGKLLDEHVIADPTNTLDGLTVASEVIVRGTGGENLVIGQAGGVDPDLGLVTRTYDMNDIKTIRDANRAAAQILAASGIVPQPLSVDLNVSAPFTFDRLIPGDLLDVRLSFGSLTLNEIMMIISVDVTIKPEKISLQLTKVSDAIPT